MKTPKIPGKCTDHFEWAKMPNPPAWPVHPAVRIECGEPDFWEGMSLRDWFAGQALAGFCAAIPFERREDLFWQSEAFDAYDAADAMLWVRAGYPEKADPKEAIPPIRTTDTPSGELK